MDNSEKNKYVKQEITNAFITLLKEKDFQTITISEITSKAQVGRVSFYRNYVSKEDILEQYMLFIIQEWENKNKTVECSTDILLKTLFEHLIAHKNFYTLLYKKGMFYLFRNIIKKTMTKNTSLSNAEAYSVAFVSYGIYGWTEEWIARGMQESAEEIFIFLQNQAVINKQS